MDFKRERIAVGHELQQDGLQCRALAQLAEGPDQEPVTARSELEAHLDRWAAQVERNLDSSSIPIKSLVEVQYGAMLAVLASGRVPKGGG